MKFKKQILQSTRIEKISYWLFFLMTFSAIVPLYFEQFSHIGGGIFVVVLTFLSWLYWGEKRPLNRIERGWVFTCLFYAGVFIASFLWHTPYTPDGEWRLSSIGFIILLVPWFILVIKLDYGRKALEVIALTSLLTASVVFLIEISEIASLGSYRFGVVYDIGRIGFIVPMTAILCGILWMQKRNKIYFVFLLFAFFLAVLNGSRTALVLLLIPVVIVGLYSLFLDKGLTTFKKVQSLFIVLILVAASGWIMKDKIVTTFSAFQTMQEGNYSSSLGQRFAMLDVGSGLAKNHVVFGVGPNFYKEKIKESALSSNYSGNVKRYIYSPTHLHNQFLMDLILSGALGLISLLLLIGYPFRVFYNAYKSGYKVEAVAAMGLMIGLWIVLFFGALFTYTYTTIFYILAMGALISYFSQKEELKE
ncbi:MAG: O-antigen ligase [Thiomicrorhabdus sp.]|nr:MAG: O-antigen ligase [Thiomicrorhabdus sp.]